MKGKARKLLLIFLEKNKHVCKGPDTGFRFQKEIRRVLGSGAQTIQRLDRTAQARCEDLRPCVGGSLEIGTKMKSSWVQPVLSVRWNASLSMSCTTLVFLLCEMLSQVLVSTSWALRAGKQANPQLLFCDVIGCLSWTLIGQGFCELVFFSWHLETMFFFFQFDWPLPWKHLMNASVLYFLNWCQGTEDCSPQTKWTREDFF